MGGPEDDSQQVEDEQEEEQKDVIEDKDDLLPLTNKIRPVPQQSHKQ